LTSSILILGVNPSSGKPNKTSATIQRLNRWMDFLHVKHYSFTNVIHTTGKYTQDLVDFEALRTFTTDANKIIALGPFVSKSLNRAHINHFTLPHPSPLNRQLNDKTFEHECLMKCKAFIGE
jgi:hypothetical protein